MNICNCFEAAAIECYCSIPSSDHRPFFLFGAMTPAAPAALVCLPINNLQIAVMITYYLAELGLALTCVDTRSINKSVHIFDCNR